MLKLFNLKKDENGSGILICIFILFLLIGIGGLAVDASILYKTKGEMRKAANAAALSGAQKIRTQNDVIIGGIVKDILDKHNLEYTSKTDNWEWKQEESYTVIEVTLKQTVPTHFMKIFKINDVPLEVTSRAKVAPIADVTGAMPLGASAQSIGLDENTEIPKNMEWANITLKTNPSETNYGKYGIISFNKSETDLKDAGAKAYKEYLENGYPGEVNIGDTLYTQSGSVAADQKIMEDKIANSIYQGKTLDDIKALYANNTLDYTDSRIMLIIIYKEGDIIDAETNIRKITVAGFAYFYLDKFTAQGNDRDIEGYLIPRVFNSLSDDNALNLGTYGIKLVE